MSHDDRSIEQLLARYRPAGPPERLERRVRSLTLQAKEQAEVAKEPRRPRRVVLARWAVAALLLLGLGLHLATERLNRQTVVAISGPAAGWSPAAEQAVELLNGNGSGRVYVHFVLAADRPKAGRMGPDVISLGAIQ